MDETERRMIVAADGTRYWVRIGTFALSYERVDGKWAGAVTLARGTRPEGLSERELLEVLERVTRSPG